MKWKSWVYVGGVFNVNIKIIDDAQTASVQFNCCLLVYICCFQSLLLLVLVVLLWVSKQHFMYWCKHKQIPWLVGICVHTHTRERQARRAGTRIDGSEVKWEKKKTQNTLCLITNVRGYEKTSCELDFETITRCSPRSLALFCLFLEEI